MNTNKLDEWAELLLDTGKGNNLINFKDTKGTTLELVAPDIETIFNKVVNMSVLEMYEPDLSAKSEKASTTAIYDKEDWISQYSSKLKANQVLPFNPFAKPVNITKALDKKAKSIIEETGVNIAYMAMGFVEWCDLDDKDTFYRAPLLLLPIKIFRKTSVDTFRISVLEDEIIFNPTFRYKVLQEYHLSLPNVENEGINEYLDKIQSLVDKLGWTVYRECKIGLFSFSKINMYQDIKDNADIILRNDNVEKLLGEIVEDTDLNDLSTSGDNLMYIHNVVDSDSSQTDAINLAKSGKSFVLQGPPGTGKSQTITNIIAECLSDGKSVLFVSEKIAALDVVYNKLKKAGLEDFCLELHSNKANKTAVIDELVRTLNLGRSRVTPRAQEEIEQKRRYQLMLDNYVKELHAVHPVINMSLYEMYDEVASCRDAEDVDFCIDDITSKGADYIRTALELIGKHMDFTKTIGYNYRDNAWFGFKNVDSSFKGKQDIKRYFDEYLTFIDEITKDSKDVNAKYGIAPSSIDDYIKYITMFSNMIKTKFLNPSLLRCHKIDAVIEKVAKMRDLSHAAKEIKSSLDAFFEQDIYKINGDETLKVLEQLYASGIKRVFSSDYKKIKSDFAKLKKHSVPLGYDNLIEYSKKIKDYQYILLQLEKGHAVLKEVLGEGYQGLDTDWDVCLEVMSIVKGYTLERFDFGELANMDEDKWNEAKIDFERIVQTYNMATEKYRQAIDFVNGCFEPRHLDIHKVPLEQLVAKLETAVADVNTLDNWCVFLENLEEMNKIGVFRFINLCIKNNYPINHYADIFKKAFYYQWADAIIHSSRTLQSFSKVGQDKAVQIFSEKDRLQFAINKIDIRASLSAKRPDNSVIVPGSPMAILMRESKKTRKQMNIRTLLSKIGDLGLALKPCFLMSPLSVSTYLDPKVLEFDVVIFDEASQICPQDAIGSIYRGKQLIVVGDTKQMPPSNFFNVTIESDDNSEEEQLEDFDSILDLCSVVLPQISLKWHYRSRFEQLIAFSNNHFYDKQLVTFPSATIDHEDVGVDYYYVEDGVFSHGSATNEKEAERVANLVFEHFDKYPERSLGVIAFSIKQQAMIEKMVEKYLLAHPEYNKFFKDDLAEPFFIKNLETVQGDERDTIIFSVAYGFDDKGKLMHNFGPLSRKGGERRLNVAVTRAKINIKLVASMHYTDIDLSKGKSVGAELLRSYLEYAEKGAEAFKTKKEEEQYNSELENEVAEFLMDNGFVVDKNVGCSSFRIDLAVKQPETNEYVLAIEFDGNGYNSCRNTRDRDRLRTEVLGGMGWTVYRLWSTEWFKNKPIEMNLLLDACQRALSAHKLCEQDVDLDKDDDESDLGDDSSDNITDDETQDNEVTADDSTDESDTTDGDAEDNMDDAKESDDVSVDEKEDDTVTQDATDDEKDNEVKADEGNDTQVDDKKSSEESLFDIDADDDSLYVLDTTDISDYVIDPVDKTEVETQDNNSTDEVNEDVTQDNDTTGEVNEDTTQDSDSEESKKSEDEIIEEEFSEEDDSKFEFAPYTKVDEVMLSFKHSKDVMKILREMLESEAPLSEEWLLKRLAGPVYDRSSVSSYVKDNFENELLMNSMGNIYRKGGYYYLSNKPVKFRASSKDVRPFEYIAVDELASGLVDLLKICRSATRDGLFKTLVKALGYARVETNQIDKLNKAIESLGDAVTLDGDMVKYND